MRKNIFTLFVFLFIASISYSQELYQIREAMDFFRANKLQSGDWSGFLTESDIEGSPYLNDEFITGNIYTSSKMQFASVPLRFNIYSDQLEFKTPEGAIQAMAAPEIVEKVEFGEYKMVYIPYSNFKKIKNGFFKVVEEGKASLYARCEIVFKKAEEPGAYKEAEPAKFVRNPDSYYIRVGLEQAKKVGNKKDLPEIFSDQRDKIAAFVKKNKIKTNKPEDLIQLVQYYSSL